MADSGTPNPQAVQSDVQENQTTECQICDTKFPNK